MQRDDPTSIHGVFQAAFNAGDIDTLVALCEPSAVLVVLSLLRLTKRGTRRVA